MAPDYCLICVTLISAINLEDKLGKKAQSPRVAFSISTSDSKWVLSTPPIIGGRNPVWNREYTLLCEEHNYKTATLSMILFHKGNKYDTPLGVVDDIRVCNLKQRQRLPVLDDESRMHGAGFLEFSVRVFHPPPPQQRFTVTVNGAQGLKNVKWLWKRISLDNLCVRKMKPYVVVKTNLGNEPPRVSPIAGKDGRDPEFNFHQTFRCEESLIQQGKVSLTIELYHRHKAKANSGSSDSDRANDIMIGAATNIKVSPMEQRQNEYRVRTPKGKDGGKLDVSIGEPEQQEQQGQEYWSLTPSPTITSWKLRSRSRGRRHFVVRNLAKLCKGFGPVAAIATAATAVAAAAA